MGVRVAPLTCEPLFLGRCGAPPAWPSVKAGRLVSRPSGCGAVWSGPITLEEFACRKPNLVAATRSRYQPSHRARAERAHQVDREASDIHCRATSKQEVIPDVGELRQRHAERRLHPLQLAQLPRSNDLLDPQSQRVVAVMESSITTRSDFALSSAISRASAALAVNGFSHNTCLPAASAARVHLPCKSFGRGL
jgi:hypothetical protein